MKLLGKLKLEELREVEEAHVQVSKMETRYMSDDEFIFWLTTIGIDCTEDYVYEMRGDGVTMFVTGVDD